MACLVMFPIIFTAGMEPSSGPGLVFVSLPVAFSQIPGGVILAPAFFLLLMFAALTSAAGRAARRPLLRVDSSRPSGFHRRSAVGGGSVLFGREFSRLTGHVFGEEGGKNRFDFFDHLASNWMLPLGGLFIALFSAWRVGAAAREEGFKSGTRLANLYWAWVHLLRYFVPVAVIAVFLYLVGF